MKRDAAYIAAAQFVLRGVGFYFDRVDADFGPDTDYAVTQFQIFRGLVDDGIVGPRTWQALRADLTFSGVGVNYFVYSAGAEINRFSMGNYNGADGRYGPWGYWVGQTGVLISLYTPGPL